jgi:hypothetical protein
MLLSFSLLPTLLGIGLNSSVDSLILRFVYFVTVNNRKRRSTMNTSLR